MIETLLDAFVRVGLDPTSPILGQIESLIGRLNNAFREGGAASGNAFSSGFARSGGGGGGRGGGGRVNRYLLGLQRQLALFSRDAALVEIDVQLRGNEDVKRELARIKNLVRVEKENFRLAEPGRSGDADRIAAIREIVRLRQDELALLQSRVALESQQRGQPPASQDLVNQLKAASLEGSTLRDEIFEIRSLVISAKNPQLAEDFRSARAEANRLRTVLTERIRDRDLVGAQRAIQQMRLVRSEFARLRAEASKGIDINTNAAGIAANFRAEVRERRIELRREQSLSRGTLSAEQRKQLVGLNAELDLAEAKFAELNAIAAKTPEIIERMETQVRRFRDAASGISEITARTNGAVTSMNTLNNNMYQAGQAIEDFAVGFELNGLKGGIRGAANNVSFLLNQLALSAAQSGAISDSFRTILPLVAGAGSAVGILVIPRLVEWITSLDEVKVKTKDISELINRIFNRAEFRVQLKLDRRSFEESVSNAKGLADTLDEIIGLQKDISKLKIEVVDIIGIAGGLGARKLITGTLDELQQVAEKSGEEIGKKLQIAIQRSLGPNILAGAFSRDEILKLGKTLNQDLGRSIEDFEKFNATFIKGTGEVRIGLLEIQNQAKNGIVDPSALGKTIDGINNIVDNFDELQKKMESPDSISQFKDNLKSIVPRLEDLREKAEQVAEKIDSVNSVALKNAISKAASLSDEYQFLRDVAEGRRIEEERILFNQDQQGKALEKQLDAIEKATVAQGGNKAVVDRLKAEARIQRALENQVDLQIRINELREELKDTAKDKVSETLTLDKAAIGVVSGLGDREEEERKKLQKELELLTNALNANTQVLRGAGVEGIQPPANRPAGGQPAAERALTPAEQLELANQAKAGRRFDAAQKRRERAFQRDQQRAEIDAAFENAMPFPLTREDQDKKDREDLQRLQEERARIRQEAEANKAKDLEDFKRFNEERKAQRDQGFQQIEEDRKKRNEAQKTTASAMKDGLSNADFSSETIEKLIAASNTLLGALNQNVSKLDTSARAA